MSSKVILKPPTPEKALSNILNSQEKETYNYNVALNEIKNGKKEKHWVWYIFPAIYTVRSSSQANIHDLPNFLAVKKYIEHPILSARFIEITQEAIKQMKKNIHPEILFMWFTDVEKIFITLFCFSIVANINKNKIMYDVTNEALNLIKSFYIHDKKTSDIFQDHIEKSYNEYIKELCGKQKGGYYYKYLKYKHKYNKIIDQ